MVKLSARQLIPQVHATLSIFSIIILFCGGDTNAAPPQMTDIYPGFEVEETVKSACLDEERQRIKKQVYTLASNRKPSKAWSVIETMLCGTSDAENSFVHNHMPEKIAFGGWKDNSKRDWDTETTLTTPFSDILLKQRAWDVSVEGNEADIRVRYRSSPLCDSLFDARFIGQNWLIVRMDQYC